MSAPFMARCGIDCEACEGREKANCPGCAGTNGKPFWGECAVATCCLTKGHDHCGQCKEFPCATLNDYAYSEGNGDDGLRIRNLREWNEKGYDAWRREREQQS